jgi:hypothetical protein
MCHAAVWSGRARYSCPRGRPAGALDVCPNPYQHFMGSTATRRVAHARHREVAAPPGKASRRTHSYCHAQGGLTCIETLSGRWS